MKKNLSSLSIKNVKIKRKKYTLKEKVAVLNLIENNMSRYKIEKTYGINPLSSPRFGWVHNYTLEDILVFGPQKKERTRN